MFDEIKSFGHENPWYIELSYLFGERHQYSVATIAGEADSRGTGSGKGTYYDHEFGDSDMRGGTPYDKKYGYGMGHGSGGGTLDGKGNG